MSRTPKVGEVWTSRHQPELTCTIDKVLKDMVSFTRSDDFLFSVGLAAFSSGDSWLPPGEPWEKPQATKRWCYVNHTGTVVIPWATRSEAMTRRQASEYGYPAIVQCDVIPYLPTFERIER